MRGVCCCERRDADGRDEAGNGILHRCSPEKAASRSRLARPLLVIELWPNSLTEYLGLQIWARGSVWMGGEDAARYRRAVAVAATIHRKAEAGLLIPVNRLGFARWVRQGGRNAFNRDWSCCCGWALARSHRTDAIGAGERRRHRS